jgi:hypothetical protein
MVFERKFSNIAELKNEPLYKKLKADIYTTKASDKVFPAIRKGEVHFYYKGGRLFKYTVGGFETHLKYGFVCNDRIKDKDITESNLNDMQIITNFVDGYKRIKERCALYNKELESFYVSKLFNKYSYVTGKDIVLLDIEAALTGSERADIVLYDTKRQIIKFVEAKLYSNGELSASEESKQILPAETVPQKETAPKVIEQIKRYEKEIKKQKDDIKKAYKKYIDIVNELFNLKLPNDNITISEKVGLIFFGFNGNDVKSEAFDKKKEALKKHIDEKNIYPIGNTDNAALKQLLRCN